MSDFETDFILDSQTRSWQTFKDIEIPNRAMNFGDGLFESMVFFDGSIRFGHKHMARLKYGMELLKLKTDSVNLEEIESLINGLLPKGIFRIRWNVFRAESGTYTPTTQEVVQTLQIKEYNAPVQVKKLAYISKKIHVYPTYWCNAKTMNSLTYVLANQERAEYEMNEVILLDHRGFVSEAGSSNIFWKIGDEIFTPSLKCSCIAGVGRAAILETLRAKHLDIHEGMYLPEHLAKASSVWVSNAMGISYLENVNGVKYSTDPLPFLDHIFE
ncbi:aminotransferase class IV [Algoriphagus lutimaris]|uniref:aminotransferase class IV n=1 Tax=Algoriphagus lutimaris TaxID=613197 RepID=UPI00196A69F9|nr:aminotransferase class IV [Algoriphagus lutimaris]MBN3519447.1 aminotransferase class IV [Algoriphagus lutimaris]